MSGYHLKIKPLLLCCGISILLTVACTNATRKPDKADTTRSKRPDTTVKVAAKPAIDTAMETDCPRGASEPVIQPAVFPDVRFALQADGMTGIETFSLPQGDRVKITQSGCEYYTLKFDIETSKFAADTTNLQYWHEAALTLMRQINKGMVTPLEISKGLEAMSARIKSGKSDPADLLSLGEELDYGGSDPRDYLTMDRISQLDNKRYLLEITFSYGPM